MFLTLLSWFLLSLYTNFIHLSKYTFKVVHFIKKKAKKNGCTKFQHTYVGKCFFFKPKMPNLTETVAEAEK